MKNRISDKIKEIEKYLGELSSIRPKSLNYYIKDIKTRAACERYFEKISEAVIDLAILAIKDKGLEIPENDYEAFDILEKNELIDKILSSRLKDMKGMRNIIAHQYGNVDDRIMFKAVDKEIETDVRNFIRIIKSIQKS